MSDARRDLHAALLAYAERQLPRVLTQMERDPDSPLAGNFDRNHWHYKIRDFSSAILQQGAYAVEALRRGHLALAGGPPLDGARLDAWVVAAVRALAGQVRRDGSVDEYYPYERSFPAAAFGLWTAMRLLADWRRDAPHRSDTLADALDERDRRALGRLAAHLDRRREVDASNQQAAGLAGLALAKTLAATLPDLRPAPSRIAEHLDRLLASQHEEGWFPEYGGPDFGYLAVTIDALVDTADALGDPEPRARIERAIDRAVDFLAALVLADGRLPSTLNSRNTDYVVPYGLARTGARNPRAAWLVETLFADAGDPAHFLWATDDRYSAHYVYASVVRALPHLARMLPPEPPPERRSLWLPGAGYRIEWASDRRFAIAVGARKGGLVRIHRRGEPSLLDHGWRVESAGALYTSNWWFGSEAAIERSETAPGSETLRLRGACRKAGFLRSRPWKHAALRLAAWTLGARLLGPLRRLLIFKPQRAAENDPAVPHFERTIAIGPDSIAVEDRLTLPAGAAARRGPRQNLRHVASAESFHPEDLAPPIPAEVASSSGRVEAHWRFPAPGPEAAAE